MELTADVPAGSVFTVMGPSGSGKSTLLSYVGGFLDPAFRAEVVRWQAAGVAALWQPRLAVIGGVDAHQPDAGLERFVGVPRMTAPARFLADELDLRLEATVTAISRDGEGWLLNTREAGAIPVRYDAVLLAVPAPQVVPLLQPVAATLAKIG